MPLPEASAQRLQAAIAARAAGNYDEARSLLDGLNVDHPGDPLIQYQLAWLHDAMGDEQGAVPYYERAVLGDLPDEALRGVLLGLGSTYRCLGQYEQATATLRQGMQRFPEAGEFPVFLSMALYNLGQHSEAMKLLLEHIARASGDPGVRAFERAIAFYAGDLDTIWK